MDYQELIEEITRLVMLEMAKFPSSGGQASGKKTLVVLDGEIEDIEGVFSALEKMDSPLPVFYVYIPPELEQEMKSLNILLPFTPLTGINRRNFKKALEGMEQVIVPYLSVSTLSAIANLTFTDSTAGLCVTALTLGKPLIFCSDNIHSLNYSPLKENKKIMGMIRVNLTTVEEMGAKVIQLNKVRDEIKQQEKETPPAEVSPGIKNVVTNDDIMVAVNQNIKVLNLPRGTIVTPLARDTALALGVEIKIV